MAYSMEESDGLWAERVHTLIAEGDKLEAMRAMRERFPELRLPEHEIRRVERIAEARHGEARL